MPKISNEMIIGVAALLALWLYSKQTAVVPKNVGTTGATDQKQAAVNAVLNAYNMGKIDQIAKDAYLAGLVEGTLTPQVVINGVTF